MALAAHIDFETRSRTELNKSGVHRYVEDPTTDFWFFYYRMDNGPVCRWGGGPDPVELLEHIAAGGRVVAHNSVFERMVWNTKTPRHWPRLMIKQMDCTMSRAAAVSRPQSLDKLCQVLKTDHRKDQDGHGIMMQMAKPRRFNPDGTLVWWDDPERLLRLGSYCELDVLTECDTDAKLPPLTASERRVWEFDQVINDRGIPINQASVQRAPDLVEYAKKQNDKEMRQLTNHAVPRCSNDAKLIEWLASRGIDTNTVRKDVQDDLIFVAGLANDTLVQDVIELRRNSKKTSTAKYAAMLKCICSDGRIRGLLNYHGAGPGRWAGRLVQPQNFARNNYKQNGHIIEWLHELLANQALTVKEIYDCITAIHGPGSVLKILSFALRSMIEAEFGNKLVGGDFSNIEGRGNAWLANETWKLDAFRAFDAGIGPDLYKLIYSLAFGVNWQDIDDDDLRRQIGKVMELALGYQGAVNAFITMGENYALNPFDLSKPVCETTPAQVWDATAARYAAAKDKCGLFEKEWTAITILVTNYRKANPNIVQSWWDYQDAAIAAVSTPGVAMACAGGKIHYYSDQKNLWSVLPSGRMICYADPRIKTEVVTYTKANGEEAERTRRQVVFWGVDDVGRWSEKYLYGGLQCENNTQGFARDVMVDRMFAMEEANYPVILTVHDEILTEVLDIPDYNKDDFKKIMSVVPQWATGLPLAASSWEDKRYVK